MGMVLGGIGLVQRALHRFSDNGPARPQDDGLLFQRGPYGALLFGAVLGKYSGSWRGVNSDVRPRIKRGIALYAFKCRCK